MLITLDTGIANLIYGKLTLHEINVLEINTKERVTIQNEGN